MPPVDQIDNTVQKQPVVSKRIISSAGSALREIHLTAQGAQPWTEGALKALFKSVARELQQDVAFLFNERLFLPEDKVEAALALRRECYQAQSVLHDEVEPTIMLAPPGVSADSSAAIQIHAVSGMQPPEAIVYNGRHVGRTLQEGDRKWVFLQAIACPEAGDEASQTSAVLERSEAILKQLGGDYFSVARTWFWLRDITDWYDRFNEKRSDFFRSCGLINRQTGKVHLPASTGIGIGTSKKADCVMDLIGIIGGKDEICYVNVGGNQHSAFDYGSAFSRASWAATPAGRSIFVSGTASIDHQGITLHENCSESQIKETLVNLRALLSDCQCTDKDVVSAIAYVKNGEVARIWDRIQKESITWPVVTISADVCRPELLFEIELTAAQPLSNGRIQ